MFWVFPLYSFSRSVFWKRDQIYIYVFLMTKQYFGNERKTDEKGTCTYNFHATENHTLRKDAFMCVCFLWKKKSILNTYLKMFLNKCLLFKELQLHLKQLSTRKAKLCWHRPFSSTAFARLSYTESRAGLLFLSMGDAKHGFAS